MCAADPACTEVKRINVSAAFFVSIEFQQTGFLVYKMYEAGFGLPSGSPVPVRREDFMPDTRTIGNGVIVNQQGWEAVLEANKNAFALAFVQRPTFTAQFPGTMTAQEFVNKLDDNVGNVLSSSEKSNLVSVLGGSTSRPD
jgi:hypothetical protein